MNEWNDPEEPVPFKGDFDPYGGCLDAQCAWNHFGGLSRNAAYEKFCQNPEYYQEDFMFMGGAAFAYYYPVIERYVLESRVSNDEGGTVEAMGILPYCIKLQFEDRLVHPVQHLRHRILAIVSHVRGNLAQYCVDSDAQLRIDSAWHELECTLRTG